MLWAWLSSNKIRLCKAKNTSIDGSNNERVLSINLDIKEIKKPPVGVRTLKKWEEETKDVLKITESRLEIVAKDN